MLLFGKDMFLCSATGEVFTHVDTMKGIKKKKLVSVRELNTFISSSNEQLG
ncbi:unnamed protein product [Brassica oleracea]